MYNRCNEYPEDGTKDQTPVSWEPEEWQVQFDPEIDRCAKVLQKVDDIQC